MKTQQAGDVAVRYVEHGEGRPVVILHGAGVDHREPEACFEPLLPAGFRRIYPDLPGMGETAASDSIRSADDVLAGGYYAQAIASRTPTIAGLALVCPLLPDARDVPEHRVIAGGGIGDETFRTYFVIQTPDMLDRYERFIAPSAKLVDAAALERIGENWQLTPSPGNPYPGPTLVVAGRLDSTVGFAASADLLDEYPHATLAVLYEAGHALPHERPELLGVLVRDWLARVIRS
jgi:pimeloyl-ACP methyl ester carboxylesterase